MFDYDCRLEDLDEDEAETIKAAYAEDAAKKYVKWYDQQAADGFSPRSVVLVKVGTEWQRHVIRGEAVIVYHVATN